MLEESTGNFSATRNVYDWYQTATHVILNIMIKNLKESDVKVKLIDETLDVSCSLADGNEFKLHFNLFKSIYVSESNWTVTPSKLEVKLKKTDRKRWQSLEVLPDKSGKRPLSFVGFVQNSAAKKANTEIVRVMSTSLVDEQPGPKYDWHQTPTQVIISIHIPNLTEQDVRVEFGEQTLFWSCKWSQGSTYDVKLNLFKVIMVDMSSWKLTVSKLEIELRKRDAGRWSNLEAPSQMLRSAAAWPSPAKSTATTSPSIAYITADGATSSTIGAAVAIGEDGQYHLIDNNGVVCSANPTGDGLVVTTSTASNSRSYDYVNLVNLEPTDIAANNGSDGELTAAANNCVSDIKNDKVLQNLDKIVTDFKEKESTDGTVDELLREIYEKGGDEVRRAMKFTGKKFGEDGAGQSTDELKDHKPDIGGGDDGNHQIDLAEDLGDQMTHTLEETPNV